MNPGPRVLIFDGDMVLLLMTDSVGGVNGVDCVSVKQLHLVELYGVVLVSYPAPGRMYPPLCQRQAERKQPQVLPPLLDNDN